MCGAVCYKITNNRAIASVHHVLNIFCLVFRSSHRISEQFVVVCTCGPGGRSRGINALYSIRVQPRRLSLERDSLRFTPKLPQPRKHVHKQMRKNLLMRRAFQVSPRSMRLHGLLCIFDPSFATWTTSRGQHERTHESWSVFFRVSFPPRSEDADRFFGVGNCFL